MTTKFVKQLSVMNIFFLLATMIVPFFAFQKAEAAGLQQTYVGQYSDYWVGVCENSRD